MKTKLLVILAVGFLVGADDPGEDAGQKELEKMQGEWRLTVAEFDGQKADDDDIKGCTLTLKGDKYTFIYSGQREEGTKRLDPTKKPKTVDVKITQGMDKGKTQLGIYQLEGDVLKMSFAMPDEKDRPTEFGKGAVILEFKRVK